MNHKNLLCSAIALVVGAAAYSTTANAVEFEVGNTKVKVGGYLKLDLIHDVNEKLGDNFAIPALVSTSGSGAEGHTNLHANQSRINFSTSTPLEGDTLVTMLEWDMLGGAGGSNKPEPRLRHAYGSWNGILAGQTWTNFVSDGAVGQMRKINFLPEPGTNPARQAQFRYSKNGFSVALEDPQNLGGEVLAGGDYQSKATLPDLTARYQSKAGDFEYAVAGVLRMLEHDNGAADDSATGWGVNLEGMYKVSSAVTLRGTIKYGDGIGGYISTSPAEKTAGYVDPTTGSLETIEQLGVAASVAVKVGPGHINLGYGMAKADMDDAVNSGAITANTANEKFEAVHLNYIWSAAKNVSYGLEISRHSRDVQSGLDGDATRLQGMVMYRF